MTDHPMFLEYDWTSNTYHSHFGGAFPSIEHSFETLAAARHALRLIGLRIGAKTDARTWRIEFMELSPSALTSPVGGVGPTGIANELNDQIRRRAARMADPPASSLRRIG